MILEWLTWKTMPQKDPVMEYIETAEIPIVYPSNRSDAHPACFHVEFDLENGCFINPRDPTIHVNFNEIKIRHNKSICIALTHELGHWFQFSLGYYKKYMPFPIHCYNWLGTAEELFGIDDIPTTEIIDIMTMFDMKWNGQPHSDVNPWYFHGCERHACTVAMMTCYPEEAAQTAPTLTNAIQNSPIAGHIDRLREGIKWYAK
jgi:hypothetical protein